MSTNSNKEKFIAQAQKLVEKGQFDKAIREYLKVVAEDDNDIRIWIRIGDLYVKLGQKNEAVENYKKVAQLYGKQADPEKAIAVYKRILEIAPGTIEAHLALGGIYREQGRLGHATQQYELASQALTRQGKVRDALRAEQAIVDIMPDSIARRIKLAELYSKENMYSDAAREFAQAAAYLRNAGRMDDYAKVAERLLFHAPTNLDALKELARYYMKAGDGPRALTRLQAGFKVAPKDPEILDLLADAFAALGKNDKSVAVLKELAHIYTERGALAAARSTWQRILGLDGNDTDAKTALSQSASLPQPTGPASGPLQAKLFNSPVPGSMPMPSGNTGGAMPLSGLSSRPLNVSSSPHLLIPTPPTGSPMSLGTLTPPAGIPIPTGQLTPPLGSPMALGSTISARMTPAAGTTLAPPSSPDEEASRLVAEADSFLRFGLSKKAVEHLQGALNRNPSLRPVRERLIKLHESQRDFKGAIAELRILLGQCSDPQEEVRFLREILRLDNQDQEAGKRLKVITGMHRVEPVYVPPPSSDDDFDEPEISIGSGDDERRAAESKKTPNIPASVLDSHLASTSEVPIAEFKKYVDKMKAEQSADGVKPQKPSKQAISQAATPSDGVPEPAPSASTRPNAAEVEAAAEELALTSGTLKEELDEVDFCLQQKMYDDARRSLKALADRYPHSKTVAAKLKQLEHPNSEVVIDVDMADVHEELIVGAHHAPAEPLPPPPALSGRSLPAPLSQRSLPAVPMSGLSASGRSLPPEFAQSSAGGASSRSLRTSQRSLPPPPPRPSRQMKTVASSDASGAFRLGVGYRNRGQYEQAIGEFEKAMGDTKRGARAALMTGLCYRDQNRTRDAIEAFKLGIHMPEVNDQDRNELYYQLGRSYELLNDVKEAIYFYQSALKKEGRFRDCADRIAALQKPK